MSYEIHLSFNNNQEGFQLPVNPAEIEVLSGSNGKTYDIVGANDGRSEVRGGEINVIKSPKLREISFEGLFPAQFYPFLATDTLYEPMYYVRAIENWKSMKRPIRFIYVAHWQQRLASQGFSGQELNIPVSIEKFKWKEIAGSPGDIEFSISLKEYVFYAARRVTVNTDATGNVVAVQQSTRRPDERIRPDTYVLKDGDTLTKIAMRFYTDAAGIPDSSRYKDIQTINGLKDSDVKKLAVGSILKLPAT
ncbi:LysM peptidoglycan-binding domain-containing protein [Paenibacillus sp. LMG 31461]|uniref:LysM peptidoglycan-binding domain-containing protein n=1 Tax=Paenibacillus plantarum TaxID=2654975 RepID=A0ABX1XJZ1_9BACL|nr:LysM peptidoglycan-binding domain-containing protein [Paenibacillus plantarum]NOU68391.1 LysM peptidoglycan-binding domain-containing protein [Paenibacillus plantarum]